MSISLTNSRPGFRIGRIFQTKRERPIYWYDKRPDTLGSGFFSELFTHVGQWGTPVDPPAHFVKGLRTVDQIDPKEMIRPLVLIGVPREAAAEPDYILSPERVREWEKDHGQIPSGAFVAMRTDWSKRWPDAAKMENKDAKGVAHYPGWSLPALKYLYEEQKVTASGHETTDTDSGIATSKNDLLAGNVHPEQEPLSGRVADEPGSSSRGWRYRRSQFPKTKERLGVSRACICNCAVSCFGE